MDDENPYVPVNMPAIGDMFDFDRDHDRDDGGDHDRGDHRHQEWQSIDKNKPNED
jgi:phospholipase C